MGDRFTNHETELAALWLNNGSEAIYNQIMEQVQAAKDQEKPLDYLTMYLQKLVFDNAPKLEPGLYNDLLDDALQDILFDVIAADFLEEADG